MVKNKVSCPKGTMLWTHRVMVFALFSVLLGVTLILSADLDQDKSIEEKKQIKLAGNVFIIIWLFLMFGSMINAIINNCWKTGLIAFLL